VVVPAPILSLSPRHLGTADNESILRFERSGIGGTKQLDRTHIIAKVDSVLVRLPYAMKSRFKNGFERICTIRASRHFQRASTLNIDGINSTANTLPVPVTRHRRAGIPGTARSTNAILQILASIATVIRIGTISIHRRRALAHIAVRIGDSR